MYPKEFFLEQFREQDTEELLERYGNMELAEEARAAIFDILAERGIARERIDPLVRDLKKSQLRGTHGNTKCDFCNRSAAFSPVRDEGQRFCTKICRDNARLLEAAVDITDAQVMQHARSARQGACPKCRHMTSPVDARRYHTVWSFLFVTSWKETTHNACIDCGRKENGTAILQCLFMGWWAPFGLVMTPIQIFSNLVEMTRRDSHEHEPSEDLLRSSRIALARAALAHEERQPAEFA